MSPDERHDLARRVLTEPQLEAWTLAERGMSQRVIAYLQSVDRSTVRSRLESARRKLASVEDEA